MQKGARLAKIQKDQLKVQQNFNIQPIQNTQISEIEFSLNQINSLIEGKLVQFKKCQGYNKDQIQNHMFFENTVAMNKIIESQLNEIIENSKLNILPNNTNNTPIKKIKNSPNEIISSVKNQKNPLQKSAHFQDEITTNEDEESIATGTGVRFNDNVIKTYSIDAQNQDSMVEDKLKNNLNPQQEQLNNQIETEYDDYDYGDENENEEEIRQQEQQQQQQLQYQNQYNQLYQPQNQYFQMNQYQEQNLQQDYYQNNQFNRGYIVQNQQIPITNQFGNYQDNNYFSQNSMQQPSPLYPMNSQIQQSNYNIFSPNYNTLQPNYTSLQSNYNTLKPNYDPNYLTNMGIPQNNNSNNIQRQLYYSEDEDDEAQEDELLQGQQGQGQSIRSKLYNEFHNGYVQSYLYHKKRQPGQPMRNQLEQNNQLKEYKKFEEKYGIEIPEFFKSEQYLQKTPRSRFFAKMTSKEFFVVAKIYEVLQTQQKVADLLDTSVPNVKRILNYVQYTLNSQPKNNSSNNLNNESLLQKPQQIIQPQPNQPQFQQLQLNPQSLLFKQPILQQPQQIQMQNQPQYQQQQINQQTLQNTQSQLLFKQ